MPKKVIYKKHILDVLSDCTLIEILTELAYLPNYKKESLLKEYTLTKDNVEKEKITNLERANNRYTLKLIERGINDRRKYIVREQKRKSRINLKKSSQKYPSFYSLFNDKNPAYLSDALSCLTSDELDLLHKKYGEDLKEYNKNLTKEENNIIWYSITRKLKRIIEKLETGDYVVLGIEDFFKNIDIKRISKIIKKENEDNKRVLYYYFGEYLKSKSVFKKKEVPQSLINVIVEIKRKLYNVEELVKVKKFASFTSQFECVRKPNESDEDLLKRIKRELPVLSDYEMTLLYLKYGRSLKQTRNRHKITKKENKIIMSRIIPKLIYFIKKREKEYKYCTPLMSAFDKLTTYEEVLEEIETFSIEDQELLKEKYKSDYLGVTKTNSLESEKNKRIAQLRGEIQRRILNKRKERTKINVSKLIKVKYILNTEEAKILISTYGLKYGASIILNKYLSATEEEIESLTGISMYLTRILTNIENQSVDEEVKIKSLVIK